MITVATRGQAGTGEVVISVRGGSEAFLAWSDEPLPKGAEVVVVDVRGPRTLQVAPSDHIGL